MNALGQLISWLLGVTLTLWIAYLLIRGAVRAGVKRGIGDALDDPAIVVKLRNLLQPPE